MSLLRVSGVASIRGHFAVFLHSLASAPAIEVHKTGRARLLVMKIPITAIRTTRRAIRRRMVTVTRPPIPSVIVVTMMPWGAAAVWPLTDPVLSPGTVVT